ncbi:class I SAM-dependent methyltransferase [Paenibacillus sedimenti]|uniref:Class I SAM-dependent methyltransferase n=1 Tax=Paenibacillus sedimenti TaxID=2770274 RepID=A0A926KUG2_9BACL|nr:class I SAM-dependent methyltransferase [Paenibacillus sedimenti]MBD0384407.1 class I SAM-dependent methyltransferase [Paenibacillus sedimenti]
MLNISEHNREAWNRMAARGCQWTLPVESDVIHSASSGEWGIRLTATKFVPRTWFPEPGKRILCLASGGGQQGPILAAAGYDVTVFDLSESQLEKDRFVAERDGLHLRLEQGDMRDLSRFAGESFDCVFHPVSNCYIPSVQPVWKEAFRVLTAGGILLSGFNNPIVYLFDVEAEEAGRLEVSYSIPYSDLTSLPKPLLDQFMENGDPVVFGHSLEDLLQGQMDAGFVLAGMYEDTMGGRRMLDPYISTYMATKALKLG